MELFILNPDLIQKIRDDKLLLTFTDPDREEIYTLQGPSAQIVGELIKKKSIKRSEFNLLTKAFQAPSEDQDALWDFCVNEKILIPSGAP